MAEDWQIHDQKTFPMTEKIFISDVPWSARPYNSKDEVVGISAIIEHLRQLKDLEYIRLKCDITRDQLRSILTSCSKLRVGVFVCRGNIVRGARHQMLAYVDQTTPECSSLMVDRVTPAHSGDRESRS